MKKIIAVVLMLALLSVASFCVIGTAVSEERGNVTLRETVLYGDKSYAEGVSVCTRAHYDDHLFWNTTYTIGEENTALTEYEFSYTEQYPYRDKIHRGITMDVYLIYGYSLSIPYEECVGLQKAYRELYDETPEGGVGRKLIRLQDYYDYYPVRVSFDLPGVVWQGIDYDLLGVRGEDERAVWDAFNDFFRIPIPENLPAFEITITKGHNSVGTGSSGLGTDYWFNSCSAYTSDRVFFSISNRLKGNTDPYVDTSLIPGGYGVYSVAYENAQTDAHTKENATVLPSGYETGIKADTLAMVFPLEQHVEVVRMSVADNESKLLLFTREDGITYLTVIDIASMTEIQKMRVTEETHYTFFEYDNCIVLNGWDDVSVIEKQADGLCRLAFTVPRMKEINDSNLQKGVATTMAFDGDRLVIVDRTGDEIYPSLELCGFTVAVYNSTGLVFYAEYKSSLSASRNPNDYAYNCLPIEYTVRWNE